MKRNINTSIFSIFRHAFPCLMFFCSIFFFHDGALAEDLSFPEYAIKAAFLYNFGKFVDWPSVSPSDLSPDTLRICIQGKDPFGDNLQEMQGKSVKSRKIEVDHINIQKNENTIENCDILFISRSEKDVLPEIIEKLEGHPVLTVSDMNDISGSGVMINLITVDDKVRFEINLNSARRAGIKISSQLLKLATRIVE